MAIVKMDLVSNDLATYRDGSGSTLFQKTISSTSGDSDIIMCPNQNAGAEFVLDVTTGAGSGTVLVTRATRAAVIADTAIWETNVEGVSAVDLHGATERITAIKCNRSTGTVSLTVTCGVVLQ